MYVNEEIKVSIIIPVYNCERYLEDCLKSVLNQTLKALEVICVDDGSTDNSVKIIEGFIRKDDRIMLLKQPNQGAGIARNHGIQNARGKYLVFLDADDYYLDKSALEKMVSLCEKKRVPVCGSMLKRLENGEEKVEGLFRELNDELKEQKIYQYIDFQFDYNYINFIFERKMIVENNIFFPDYRRFQDPPFMVKAMYQAGKFVVADTYLYCYRKPEMAARFTQERVIDLLNGLIDNLIFAKEHDLDKLFLATQKRLEYEYAGIIYHNISGDSKRILELLLQANQIVCDWKSDDRYTIRPLRRMLELVGADDMMYEGRLLEGIKTQGEIALYGAGKYAKAFLCYLRKQGLEDRVKQIVVSSLKDNGETLDGIPLVAVQNFSDEKMRLYVTLGAHFHEEIEETLEKSEIRNYQFVDDVFLSKLP